MVNKKTPAKAKAKPTRERKQRLRTVLEGGRRRLYVPESQKDPNYHYCWHTDVNGKCFDLLETGWEFVTRDQMSSIGDIDVHNDNSDLGNKVSRVVGTSEANTPLRTYLMRQHKEFYEEDRAVRREAMDRADAALGAGNDSGVENAYGEVRLSRK